jgi:hypothetical protein
MITVALRRMSAGFLDDSVCWCMQLFGQNKAPLRIFAQLLGIAQQDGWQDAIRLRFRSYIAPLLPSKSRRKSSVCCRIYASMPSNTQAMPFSIPEPYCVCATYQLD